MATTDTSVPQVIVNKLTKAQYDAATKSPTEFYAVTDEDIYSDFTGATSSTAGDHGLVPAPAAGDEDKVLKGDGTWGTIQSATNTIFYMNSSESGSTRHIYKNPDMTGLASSKDVFDANEIGQVILRISTSVTPDQYSDCYLQNAYKATGDYQLIFLDEKTYRSFDTTNITDTTFYYGTRVLQSELTAGTNVQINGTTISATDTTYSDFVGSTGVADGAAGLVPKPLIADTGKFLKGDGSWDTPADTTYTAGTNVNISAQNVISATDTTYSAFTGATSSVAGASGLVPAPTTSDPDKYLKGDGTWAEPAAKLVEMSYGESSAWAKFIAAYNAGSIVYCRASSNANPGTGSQTRKAFMAYVNNATTPTSVEFQYVRSVSSKSSSQPVDQVFVYTLTNANGGTWSVATRDMGPKTAAGTGIGVNYSSGTYTISANAMTGASAGTAGTAGIVPAPAAGDEGKFLRADGTWANAGGGGNDCHFYMGIPQMMTPYGNLNGFKAFYQNWYEVATSLNLFTDDTRTSALTGNEILQILNDGDKIYVHFTDTNNNDAAVGELKLDGPYTGIITATFPLFSSMTGESLYGIALDGVFKAPLSQSSTPVSFSCVAKTNGTKFPMFMRGFDYMNWSQYPPQTGPIGLGDIFFTAYGGKTGQNYESYAYLLTVGFQEALREAILAGSTFLFGTSGDQMNGTVYYPNMWQAIGHFDTMQAASAGSDTSLTYLLPVLEIRQLTGSGRRAAIQFGSSGVQTITYYSN